MSDHLGADEVAALLGLVPLPDEGGRWARTLHDGNSSAIHYLLSDGDFSAMHRLDGPEVYHHYAGSPAVLLLLFGDGSAAIVLLASEEHRRRLAQDEKYRAENLMIVDLLRHDVASVCEPGSVEVPQLMEVESYASVHQLVSTVRGRLREDVGTVEALRALFPAGSMTGAPKLRTMEVIEEVEATPRGVYAGAFGWVSGDGRADLGVVIRSLVTGGDGRYVLGTGGGITVLSDPAEEHAEAELKAARLLQALARPAREGDS